MRLSMGALSLLLSGLIFGQTRIQKNSPITTTEFITNSGSNITWSSGGFVVSGGSGGGGSTTETRKDDGKGPTLIQIKASAHKIPSQSIATPTWLKLAKQINLESPAVDEARLAQVINDHDWNVYDYAKVDDFLYRQALRLGTNTRWVWKPLREVDVKPSQTAASWSLRPQMGFIYPKVYGRAVPERILGKAACVIEDMKDAIFLVSDFEVIKPDPFLAVTTEKLLSEDKIFIVDQWNEPGFTEAPSRVVSAPRNDGKQLAANH